MKAAMAILACVIPGVVMLWRALGAMCQEELETRIGRLPNALIRLAALRLPRDVRSDLAEEWVAELDFIVSETDGLPVTRLLRGLTYATSLFRVAPSVGHELTCTCSRPIRLEIIARTAWFTLFNAGAGLAMGLAIASFTYLHQAGVGVWAAPAALGFLIVRRLPLLATQPLQIHGGPRFAVGFLALAASEFVQGGGWGIASGIVFAITTPVFTLFCWWLNKLSMERA
jgi:hypothetical protein